MKSGVVFYEKQRFPLRRIAVALAAPPCFMLGLLVWQVALGHPWGRQPMSNANVVGWTIFLWIVCFRLITVQLVVEVRDGELLVGLRGLWRARRVPLGNIQSVETVTFDPQRDYGGYGVRSSRQGTAYIASGDRGVRLRLAKGATLVIGSQRAEELAGILSSSAKRAHRSRS